MSKLTKLCRAKFDRINAINKAMDAGACPASVKREMIARDTDGRTRRQREVQNAGQYHNPTGKRHVAGRDDTQWINRKNAGKAGKFAGY